MAFYSPLRYPGGKGKLAPYIARVIAMNGFNSYCYVEPYAGGAGVALYLLLQNIVSRAIINDLDFHIYAFWKCVLHNTEELCELIEKTPVTMDSWHAQKAIHDDSENQDVLSVGFATFFLNRTNRSGILTGGVIGGKSQNGTYKMDARFNKQALIARIRAIGSRRNSIEIFNEDAGKLVQALKLSSQDQYIFYFDPPYFKKGALLYRNSYEGKDHWDLAILIKSLFHPWIATYDRRAEIEEMYDGTASYAFDISYSAHLTRPRGLEVLFYGNLDLPSAPYTRKNSAKKNSG